MGIHLSCDLSPTWKCKDTAAAAKSLQSEEAEGPEPKSVWEAFEASLLLELHQYYMVSKVSGQVGCN